MKRLAPIAASVVVAAALLSAAVSAAPSPTCGRLVVEDWYDNGRIGRLYPLRCYRDALARLPILDSGWAREDIARAYEYAKRGRVAPLPTGRQAAMAATRAYAEWSAAVRAGAARDPQQRFSNPSIGVLRRRLEGVERRYDVRLRQLYVMWPRQQAPYVVVSTNHPAALARAVPAIMRTLDPKRPTGDDRTGWAYEGFFLEALDAGGKPFLVVFNHWRGSHAGGGQWAAAKELLPFPHG